jgi:hypothetical protein
MAKSKSEPAAVAGSQKKDLLLAMAAVITAVATILTAVIGPKGLFEAVAQLSADTPLPTVEPTAVSMPVTAANCYFFDGIEQQYIVTVDLDNETTWQLPTNHTADDVIAIRLLDPQTFAFIGGVKLRYVEDDEMFEVVTAVNAECEAQLDFTKEYAVKSGGIFLLVIDNHEYALQFLVTARQIKFIFTKSA